MAAPAGILYGWGRVGDKVPTSFPVKGKGVDAAGDCPYPVVVALAGAGAKPPLVRKVSADNGMFAALDERGRVWGWAGMRGKGDVQNDPSVLPYKAPAVDVAAGGTFVVAVLEDGSAACLGGVEDVVQPPSGTTFVACDACEKIVMLLDAAGRLYATSTPKLAPQLIPGLPDDDSVVSFSAGAMCFAAATARGRLFTWGDGLQGTLGLGVNVKKTVETATRVPGFGDEDGERAAVSVACCRGQSNPKRHGTEPGQEGPRVHVTTADGRLHIAGTTHKGLGADHLHKVLYGPCDHLSFYEVGGAAADPKGAPCPTGAAEDLAATPEEAAHRMAVEPGNYGKDGRTHYLETARIVHSTPAHIHSLALSDDGRLFAWGCGSNGRTGLRAFMRGPGGSKRRMKCYVSTPTAIEALDGRRVLNYGIGRYWGFAIVEPLSSRPASAAGPA